MFLKEMWKFENVEEMSTMSNFIKFLESKLRKLKKRIFFNFLIIEQKFIKKGGNHIFEKEVLNV